MKRGSSKINNIFLCFEQNFFVHKLYSDSNCKIKKSQVLNQTDIHIVQYYDTLFFINILVLIFIPNSNSCFLWNTLRIHYKLWLLESSLKNNCTRGSLCFRAGCNCEIIRVLFTSSHFVFRKCIGSFQWNYRIRILFHLNNLIIGFYIQTF